MRCSKLARPALLIPLLSLAGCATAVSDACPPVVDYDAATLGRAAAELEKLGEDAAIGRMVRDYGVMRAQARACGG